MKRFLFVIFLFASSEVFALHSDAVIKRNEPLGRRIIGGEPAAAGRFPWQAAIHVNLDSGRYFCGGAIISGNYILTAAHCVDNAKLFTIYLGSNHLQSSDPNRVIVATSTAIKHPDYNPFTLENDIALIKVHMTIPFSDYISKIALSSSTLSEGVKIAVAGWGQTNDNTPGTTNDLNFVDLVTISNAECQSYFTSTLFDTMVCATGNFNEGICIGDTGGPAIDSNNGSIVAVASFMSGRGCESADPSGFTRVEPYLEWINGYISD